MMTSRLYEICIGLACHANVEAHDDGTIVWAYTPWGERWLNPAHQRTIEAGITRAPHERCFRHEGVLIRRRTPSALSTPS
jgi:hypothetical protein